MNKVSPEKFEKYFQEWLDEIQKPEIMISSDTADYVDNEQYKKIIKLGKNALPFIMNKIAQGYFFLNHAVAEITGIKLSEIIPAEIKPTSQQEISRLWLTWWKKQKQTHVVNSVGTGQFIKTWAKLFEDVHRYPNQLTEKNILNLPPISDPETLKLDELESMIKNIRRKLDKSMLELSLISPDVTVNTYVHLIPGAALFYALVRADSSIDKMFSTGGIVSNVKSLVPNPLYKKDGFLEEIEK